MADTTSFRENAKKDRQDIVPVLGLIDGEAKLLSVVDPMSFDHQALGPQVKGYQTIFLRAPESFVVVAMTPSERALGYGLVEVFPETKEDATSTWEFGQRGAELHSLSVEPRFRQRGLGNKLLQRCAKELEARSVDQWFVSVVSANVDAARLYLQNGFVPWVNCYVANTGINKSL